MSTRVSQRYSMSSIPGLLANAKIILNAWHGEVWEAGGSDGNAEAYCQKMLLNLIQAF